MTAPKSLLQAAKQQRAIDDNRLRMALAVLELAAFAAICTLGMMRDDSLYAAPLTKTFFLTLAVNRYWRMCNIG